MAWVFIKKKYWSFVNELLLILHMRIRYFIIILNKDKDELRNISFVTIKDLDSGSWLIRTSNIKDNPEKNMYAIVITCKNDLLEHYIILHVWGNGLCIVSLPRFYDLADPIFNYLALNTKWFPCLLDILKWFFANKKIILSKFIVV